MTAGGSLPTGRLGQLLALGVTALLLAILWLGLLSPLLELYRDRQELLQQRELVAVRMQAVADSLAAVQREAADAEASGPPPRSVFDGTSDAVDGAALQGQIDQMARTAGATLTSSEALPTEQAGAYRRIGVHLSLSATWPTLVALLRAVAVATPRMLTDDLQLQGSPLLVHSSALPLDASLTVFAFRTGHADPKPQ